MTICFILIFPLVTALLAILLRNRKLNTILLILYPVLYLAATVRLALHNEQFTQYFRVDVTNLIFLAVLAVVYLACSIQSMSFLAGPDIDDRRHTYFTVAMLTFVFSMTGVILSTHLGLLWVFIEATTLSSAFFVYMERSKASLEATWKYVFICSIGISIAFIGIIFFSIAAKQINSLFFDDILNNINGISPFWLKFSFPFILMGFGTKVGLAPMHAWLPDAHSESPAPASAMLSGTLLNTALLGILHFFNIMESAGLRYYASTLLMVTGFASLFICAVYILKVVNYKRMLAYSSVENMGIIAIGVACGGAGVFAAYLHIICHSLAKSSLFLTSGNIYTTYKTKNIEEVKGLLKTDPVNGWLWIISFFTITGFPPSPVFISEFLIARQLFQNGFYVLLTLYFFLLTIIIYGMGSTVLKMSFGSCGEDHSKTSVKHRFLSVFPQMVLLVLMLILFVSMPDFVYSMIKLAS
ncbi:MAG: proton-conducting transporter membrane subunit [Desulfobacterium sp.]|nr:proton-conducting transporter membrane subunit [Desulfobacterium sp.]